MNGLSPVLNIVLSVVPLTTDLIVGIFGPITCSGYTWLAEVLQYTMYVVMMPFLGMGGVQTAKSWLADPRMKLSETLSGGDGTA